MGPATFVILLIVGVMIVVGARILLSAAARKDAALRCPHPDCGHPNDPNARFCARCGKALGDQ